MTFFHTPLRVFVIIAAFVVVALSQCQTCKNGAACCDKSVCCGVGDSCCPASTTCCNDTCCDQQTQSCCPDPNEGGVCCEKETTFCCAPDIKFPSRCCPRWMVCCPEGELGCCLNPSLSEDEVMRLKVTKSTAHALFEVANFDGTVPMVGVTIDLQSGDQKQENIQSPFNNWGEMTRMFEYDSTRDVFYLLQANFLQTDAKDPMQVITLYTLNTTSGKGTSAVVKGAVDQVTGFVFHKPSRKIIMATYAYQGDQIIGYKFFTVDPISAVATLVSFFQNDAGVDSYAGWNFQKVSDDGTLVFRLGHRDPTKGDVFGLSIVDISTSTASLTFVGNFTVLPGFSNYFTFHVMGLTKRGPFSIKSPKYDKKPRSVLSQVADLQFLSLATSTDASSAGEISLIQWSLNGPAQVFASLGNAYLPEYFGPVEPYLSSDFSTYIVAAVYDDPLNDNFDRWEICTVDLTGQPGGSSTNVILYPWMLGGTDGISGLGIPDWDFN